MRKRITRFLIPLLGVAAIAAAALTLSSSEAGAATCNSFLNGNVGQIWCPGAPSPGYTLISSNEFTPNNFWGEGSTTYYRVECWSGSGSSWVQNGADQYGFNGACPSNKPYIKMTKCGDGAFCMDP